MENIPRVLRLDDDRTGNDSRQHVMLSIIQLVSVDENEFHVPLINNINKCKSRHNKLLKQIFLGIGYVSS